MRHTRRGYINRYATAIFIPIAFQITYKADKMPESNFFIRSSETSKIFSVNFGVYMLWYRISTCAPLKTRKRAFTVFQ